MTSSTVLLVFTRFYVGRRGAAGEAAREWVGSGEEFVDPLLLFVSGLGAHTAAVVDFLQVFLFEIMFDSKRCGSSAPIVCNEGLFFFVTIVYLFNKKKEPFYLNYCDYAFFIKAPTVAWCLRPSVWEWMLDVGSGTCRQLLRVSVQRTFHYFFKLCGTFFVVGFWHLGNCVCVWERVWKLRCIFEWSWTKLLHRLLSVCLI